MSPAVDRHERSREIWWDQLNADARSTAFSATGCNQRTVQPPILAVDSARRNSRGSMQSLERRKEARNSMEGRRSGRTGNWEGEARDAGWFSVSATKPPCRIVMLLARVLGVHLLDLRITNVAAGERTKSSEFLKVPCSPTTRLENLDNAVSPRSLPANPQRMRFSGNFDWRAPSWRHIKHGSNGNSHELWKSRRGNEGLGFSRQIARTRTILAGSLAGNSRYNSRVIYDAKKIRYPIFTHGRGCRPLITLRSGSEGEVGSSFACLLSQRASGVSVVWLSISPGKSTEMENEIAARPCSAHRRHQGNAWSINPIGVYVDSVPRPSAGPRNVISFNGNTMHTRARKIRINALMLAARATIVREAARLRAFYWD